MVSRKFVNPNLRSSKEGAAFLMYCLTLRRYMGQCGTTVACLKISARERMASSTCSGEGRDGCPAEEPAEDEDDESPVATDTCSRGALTWGCASRTAASEVAGSCETPSLSAEGSRAAT